jgi:DNA-binding transcriptional ArsR family regulator
MVNRSLGPVTTFAALGSPARLAIIERLRAGEAPVTELARPLPMSLAAVSKHLGVLERAGVVRRRVEGRVHWIALDPRPLEEARGWLADGAAFWQGRLDALESALSAQGSEERAERSA